MLWLLVLALGLASLGIVVWQVKKQHDTDSQTRVARFDRALRSLLLHGDQEGFVDAEELATSFELTRREFRKVTERFYGHFLKNALADHKITASEREQLNNIASRLCLPKPVAERIEDLQKDGIYVKKTEEVLADGKIDRREEQQLRKIRAVFGIGPQELTKETPPHIRDHLEKGIKLILQDDEITANDAAWLDHQADALGIDVQSVRNHFLDLGADCYRRITTWASQDGKITPKEEEHLRRLAAYFNLPAELIERSNKILAETRVISEIRTGKLPTVASPIAMASSEICHFHERALWNWGRLLRKGKPDLEGTLVVSSTRLYFTSVEKGIDFSLSKITNVEFQGPRLGIIVTGQYGGTHWFELSSCRLAAEIIDAAVKVDNRELAGTFAVEQSRHIPQDVKTAVWKRDGGKCVQCDSRYELEYDHIIPYSKGGSNSERNIQLLCGPCNRTKSDKI